MQKKKKKTLKNNSSLYFFRNIPPDPPPLCFCHISPPISLHSPLTLPSDNHTTTKMAGFGGNLFGSAEQQAQGQGTQAALTFKAGKMHKTGTTVRADTRKGQIVILGDQSFIHFQWKDRATGLVEDDLMVFKDEAEYFRVDKCTTGRVYVLQFKQGSNAVERFFWMQEPSEEEDANYCKKINNFIKNPATCVAGAGGAAPLGGGLADLHRQTGGGGGGVGGGGAHRGGAARTPIDMTTLQGILSDISGRVPPAGGEQPQAAPQAAPAEPQRRAPDVELTDMFSQDSVRAVLSGDPAGFEQRLSEHFPEGIETSVLEEIRSPQFRQSLELLQVCQYEELGNGRGMKE